MKTIKASAFDDMRYGFTGIIEHSDGTREWFYKDEYHREDGPAIESPNGEYLWYRNGKLHRIDGPAWEYADGSKEWWLNGKLHRIDGPAWEYANGTKRWYMDGKLHRVDGPARVWPDGTKDWYLNGSFVYALLKSIVDYIVIEEGLPSTMEWLGEPVSTLKVLTAEGIKFIPNLPGI